MTVCVCANYYSFVLKTLVVKKFQQYVLKAFLSSFIVTCMNDANVICLTQHILNKKIMVVTLFGGKRKKKFIYHNF